MSNEIVEKISELKIENNIRENSFVKENEEVLILDNFYNYEYKEENFSKIKSSSIQDDLIDYNKDKKDVKTFPNVSILNGSSIKSKNSKKKLFYDKEFNKTALNKTNKKISNKRQIPQLNINHDFLNKIGLLDKKIHYENIVRNNNATMYRLKNKNKKIPENYSKIKFKTLLLTSLNSIYSNKISCLIKAKLQEGNIIKEMDSSNKDKSENNHKYFKKGSILLSKNNKLLGLLLINSGDEFIFINLESVYYILEQIKDEKNFKINGIKRPIINLDFTLIPFGKAINSYNLSRNFFYKYIHKKLIKTENKEKVLIVHSINKLIKNEEDIEENELFNIRPGDILFKINNIIIGNDLLMINKILNEKLII